MQQLIQFSVSGLGVPQMPEGRSQDSVNVRKFRIGFTGVPRELDCLFVSLGQQCRPAFAEMPDDHQQALAG